MNDGDVRVQGGVFIWFSALSTAVAALVTVFRLNAGFWQLFFACLAAAAVGVAARILFGRVIAARAGRLDLERGPMIGLICMSVSVFVIGYYMQLQTSRHDPPYFKSWLTWSFLSLTLSYGALLIGRSLNIYAAGVTFRSLRVSCSKMSVMARATCVSIWAVTLTSATIFLGYLVFGSHSFRQWMILSNSVFTSFGLLVLFAVLRKRIFGMFVKLVWQERLARRCPNEPHVVLGNAFSIPEISAVMVFGVCETLLYMVFPRLFRDSFVITTTLVSLLAFVVLCAIWYLDGPHLLAQLRNRWRDDVLAFVHSKLDAMSRRHASAVRACIIQHFMRSGKDRWEDQSLVMSFAEDARRMLNLRFCQDGVMRYIARYDVLGKREVMAIYMGQLFDTHRAPPQNGIDIGDDVSDEDLERKLEEVKSLSEDEESELIEAEAMSCIHDLSSRIDVAQLQPRCRLNMCFRAGGQCRFIDIELDAMGKAGLTESVDGEVRYLMQFASGSFEDAVGLLEEILVMA